MNQSKELTPDTIHCYHVLAAACRPRDRLTVSTWADRHRWLSSKQSGEPGKWRTARNPMLREIMDCFSVHSTVDDLTVMKSSQVGITECVVNVLGYSIEHSPCPVMVMLPTIESRDGWKTQKLNPMLTETAAVRNILGGMRSRDAANSKDAIDFPGGILFLAGGNSPNSYAQKTVRRMIMDDLDRFPEEVGNEGDPVALGKGRLKAMARSIFAKISTPTIAGVSLIEREYEASDQRRYHIACSSCHVEQSLKWSNLKWNNLMTAVWYECEHCGHEIQEHHKPIMLANGRWIAANPKIKRRGYHISALYAPIGLGPSWLNLAQEFIVAKDDQGTLKTFTNTQLGETWRDEARTIKPHELSKRMEDIPMRTLPIGCLALTVGVDTQDQWLAVQLLGWGANHLWIVEYHEIKGDTTRPEIWNDLEAYLHTKILNAYGKPIRLRAVGIDSRGHRGVYVRQFVTRPSLKVSVFAVQGSTLRLNRPIALTASHPDRTRKGKPLPGGYGLWNIGTEHCKDFLLKRLVSDEDHPPEDRVLRFPAGLDDDYFHGLLSEYYDPVKKRYIQKKGAKHKRNEPLDTLVYAWAIGNHKQIALGKARNGRVDPHYWDRLATVLEPANMEPGIIPPEIPPASKSAQTKRPPVRRGGFVNRWKQ